MYKQLKNLYIFHYFTIINIDCFNYEKNNTKIYQIISNFNFIKYSTFNY